MRLPHSLNVALVLADLLTRKSKPPAPAEPSETRVRVRANRNDPCPCGSGMKFKKCCKNVREFVPAPTPETGTPPEGQ